jgi:hypothetical protein
MRRTPKGILGPAGFLAIMGLFLGACAHPASMLGVSGGTGANVTIQGPSAARLLEVGKTVLEQNGCAVTSESRDSNPAVLYCSGPQAGNGKLEITELSPTSHRVTMWNSQSGLTSKGGEKSFVNLVLRTIQVNSR